MSSDNPDIRILFDQVPSAKSEIILLSESTNISELVVDSFSDSPHPPFDVINELLVIYVIIGF